MSILTPERPAAQPPATTRADGPSTSSAATPPSRAAAGNAPSNRLPIGWLGVPIRAWWMIGLLTVVFAATYRTNLWRLWLKTNPINGTADWPHAVFIPIVGIYFLLLNLDDVLKEPVKPLLGADFKPYRFISAGAAFALGLVLWKVLPTLPGPFQAYATEIGSLGVGIVLLGVFGLAFDWGIGLLLAGLACFVYGVYPGRNDFVKDVGMVISVFGAVLTIGGWRIMKWAWFPCAFLFFALPWPGLFYQKVAGPMQVLAAQVAVGVMTILGVDVDNKATQIIIHTPGVVEPRILNVAEACAGLRSLMTFVSLAAAIAFLSSRPLWQKLIITFAGVPIAVACNVMRVTGQGLLDYYVDQSWSSGFAHQFAGIVMLLPGFLMLLGLVWVLDKLFIEEDDSAAIAATAKTGGAA